MKNSKKTVKDYIDTSKGFERRYSEMPIKVVMEKREDSETEEVKAIEFTPIVFNRVADLGWFEEMIEPQAFDGLIETEDVRALKNHNPNYVMARSNKGKGTLTMAITKTGVDCSFVPRKRTYIDDLVDEIDAEDISQGSFAFLADVQEWRYSEKYGEGGLRVVKKVRVWRDVSIVTYPAYKDTSVAKRSQQEFIAKNKSEADNKDEQKKGSLGIRQAQININKNKM